MHVIPSRSIQNLSVDHVGGPRFEICLGRVHSPIVQTLHIKIEVSGVVVSFLTPAVPGHDVRPSLRSSNLVCYTHGRSLLPKPAV